MKQLREGFWGGVTITRVAPTGIDPVTFRFSVGSGGVIGAR